MRTERSARQDRKNKRTDKNRNVKRGAQKCREFCSLADRRTTIKRNSSRPKKELGHSVEHNVRAIEFTLQTETGVSMTEISGLIDMLLKRMMVIVDIVMMVMMMTMIVMIIRMMVIMITVVIREIIVGGGLAVRVPGSR